MTITYISTYNGTSAHIDVRKQPQKNLSFYKTIFENHLGLKNMKPKMGMQGMKTRRVMKMEKPRPLKISTLGDQSMESVLSEMDLVSQQLNSGTWDRTLYSSIASLCESLKMFGPQLENVYKDQLDKCFISFRNGCRDDRLSLSARYRLLEVIEVRAMHWQPNENLINYYKQKLAQFEAEEAVMEEQVDLTGGYMTPGNIMTPTSGTTPLFPGQVPQYQQQLLYTQQQIQQQQQQQQILPTQQPATPTLLAPGEIIKSSGKFPKPTRIAGKNYCKDEVVIRNADSGKVMGIKGRRVHMIEELSETIISFQRVAPGARERLVQITGPNEENIAQAKQLIEETIRRNASPVRNEDRGSIYTSLGGSSSSISSHTSDETLQGSKRSTLIHNNSMTEEPMQEYRYTVTNGQDAIRITGNNLNLVRTAKLVLDEFFNGERNFNNIAMLLAPESREGANNTPANDHPSPAPVSHSTGRTSPAKTPSPKTSSTSDIGDGPQADTPKSGVVTVTRQPLIPSSSKEAIESVENDNQVGNESAKSRRAMFAKTSEDRSSTEDDEVLIPSVRRVYTREFLVKCAASPLARRTPENWGKVIQQNPAILKKSWLYLPAVVATLAKSGEVALSAVPSYLKTNDMVEPKDLIRGVLEINWSNMRTYSTTEDDDNGNTTTLSAHERRASHSS